MIGANQSKPCRVKCRRNGELSVGRRETAVVRLHPAVPSNELPLLRGTNRNVYLTKRRIFL